MSFIALTKLEKIIASLKTVANEIDDQNTHNKAHKILEDGRLFSPNLFKTNSDKFFPYILEAEKGLKELAFFLKQDKKELAHSLLQTIEQQLSALHNATSANNVMHNEAKLRQKKLSQIKYKNIAKKMMLSSHQLYQQLSEYHEFERRLLDMLNQKNIELSKHQNNDKLTNDVLVLHQRLGRCRQAISKVERHIEASEKSQLK